MHKLNQNFIICKKNKNSMNLKILIDQYFFELIFNLINFIQNQST